MGRRIPASAGMTDRKGLPKNARRPREKPALECFNRGRGPILQPQRVPHADRSLQGTVDSLHNRLQGQDAGVRCPA
jgi:hypothetical protein